MARLVPWPTRGISLPRLRSIDMATYANGRQVTETEQEATLKSGTLEEREAFKAGCGAQARHWQEEIPPELRALVNRVRALAVLPGAQFRSPESILHEALCELPDVLALDSWPRTA